MQGMINLQIVDEWRSHSVALAKIDKILVLQGKSFPTLSNDIASNIIRFAALKAPINPSNSHSHYHLSGDLNHFQTPIHLFLDG